MTAPGAFVPGTRIEAAVKSLDRFLVPSLADYQFSNHKSFAVRTGHKEKAVEAASGRNVYTMEWVDMGGKFLTLCFFGDTEWEVLDRLGVAEVMLE